MTWLRFVICLFAPIGIASIAVSIMRGEIVWFTGLTLETQIVALACAGAMLVDAWVGQRSPEEQFNG